VPADRAANEALVNRFYEAFARQDGETMAACYTPDAHFHDPVFQDLHGDEVGAMWRMLCARATDLKIVHSAVTTDEDSGSAHWEADYTFSTGRAVHNVIDATFTFEHGLIADHRDDFDLYAWARQALGPVGLLLGWSPPVQNKIRGQAREGLDEFMAGGPPASTAPE
jgi:ketosteroid isomerase-like protein